MDQWTKEELTDRIAQLAKTYVPEWKFDPAHPDAGAALALIFAEMFYENIVRCRRMPEKLKRSFFGQIGLAAHPSAVAEGYVTFGLSSHEFGGAMLPERTVVIGADQKTGEDVIYETAEALYVTPARLTQVIYTDGREDCIEYKDFKQPFLPLASEGQNLQEHTFYLCQNEVLQVTGKAEIGLKLVASDGDMAWLADERKLSVAYAAGGGFEEFKTRKMKDRYLILEKAQTQPEPEQTELFGKTGFWIRCRCIGPWEREPFWIKDVRMTAKRDNIKPDLIQTDLGEQPEEHIHPFGENPMLFRECYFASEETLGKTGARVRMTFRLWYERIPFDNSIHIERQWKMLMKRADFVPDPEYDITVEQVAWEYFNGAGWSRLSLDAEAVSMFNGRHEAAGEKVSIEFECPKDAALLEWQCKPTRYIRVRVLRMENLYKLKGHYITPVISDVRFCYFYQGEGCRPDFAAAQNGLEHVVFPVNQLGRGEACWNVFYGLLDQRRSLYLGFDRPLSEGPVKLYCAIGKNAGEKLPQLSFEYCGKSGFLPLQVLDGTGSLQKSGCLTIFGKSDFELHTVCGKKAYWVRVTDETDAYRAGEKETGSPGITGMYLNTVKVLARESRPREFFKIEAGEQNKVCHLLKGNICELAVWVNELITLAPSEREALQKTGRLREERDEAGLLNGIWVRWEETGSFDRSGKGDRHYLLDRSSGTVTFSDGKKGAIPSSGKGETICIVYRCGGGAAGNQPVGGINRLGSSQGYVSRVTNYMPVCGGYDRETVSEAMQRAGKAMRHMGRAVTASDFEALAKEASRLVQKVKCYPGYNPRGEYEPGSVTLVVLWRGFENGGMLSHKIREDIKNYISCHMAAMGHLYVTEPQFVEVNCYARIVIADPAHVLKVQRTARQQLERFIHPITGNYHGKGWEIGTVPNETQLTNALKELGEISYIREVRMTVGQKATRFAVAQSGRHIVEVEAE